MLSDMIEGDIDTHSTGHYNHGVWNNIKEILSQMSRLKSKSSQAS